MFSKFMFAMSILLTKVVIVSAAEASHLEIPIETILAPSYGFEEKNLVQVVAYGALPDACYSLGEHKIEVSPDGKTVKVRQFASRMNNGICAQESTLPIHMTLTIPFTSEISVGHLKAGNYTFAYNKGDGLNGSRLINVGSNVTPTVDTLPYADVSNTTVQEVTNEKENIEVTLSGILNSSCTELDSNVQILNQGDVFVLLPTIKVKSGVLCAQAMIPFAKKVNLGKSKSGRYLVHTRSMNGKAVNRIVEVFK